MRPLLLTLAFIATVAAAEPPRLAVVISIDQFRADYLERFHPYFAAGGFRRLLEGGAVYSECHYRNALTATAPGHATIVSGVYPEMHGIIANEWIDPETWRQSAAVSDPRAPLVGLMARAGRSPGGVLEAREGASPRRFLATTVGDQLKLRHRERSRVIAVANKDRAAILLGGRLADGAYWMHESRFVTSTYYRDALPAWVEAFNAEGRIDQAFGQEWTRLLDPSVYDAVQGPDAAPGEEPRLGLGVTFPRRIDGGTPEISSKFHEAYRLAPASSELLGLFAQRAITAEQLGRHDATDLLCIGFSQIDYVGHSFGPDSHEVMDAVLRLDRVLAALLDFLDTELGTNNYTVVVTSDHAVSPLPERVQGFERGIRAGRLDGPALDRAVEDALTDAFGPVPGNAYWASRDAYGYRLRPETLAARGVTPSRAATVAKAALLRSPQIAVAWTRDELTDPSLAHGPYLSEWRRSYFPPRSPDVVFSPIPYVIDRSPAGTNHGSPYDYDNHVPLLWFGAGVVPAAHSAQVAVEDIAPTLASLLGVPRPPEALGRRLF
ncbi:MAG TPA: alkaline phosphatase family protein [Opitutaceae bacterium]